MRELNLQNLPIISLMTFILGLVIIIFSPVLGNGTETAFLVSFYGGGMDADRASAMLQGSINSYYMIGAILLFFGGLGSLISFIFEQQKQ